MGTKFYVDKDIKKAATLPASFYKDTDIFNLIKEKIFLSSWQFAGDEQLVKVP